MGDVTELMGGPQANTGATFGSDSEPGKVVPHVLTFGQLLNTIAKTYSYRYDEALRHLPSNALAMRRDCYIRSLLNERKLPTAQHEWQIEVDNPNDARQKEVQDGLTQAVKRIKRFTRLRLYLMDAIWYGRYGSQGRWERQDVGGGAALWTFTRHKPVNGDKIQYAWDDTPAVAISAIAAKNYPLEYIRYTDRFPVLLLGRPEWRRQFLIHTHEVDDADYFEGEMAGAVDGTGLRSQIYWAWWLRDECLGWIMDFMQKVGTLGLLIFWYEEGSKAGKAAAEQNAKEANTKVALVMPRPAGNDKQTWGVEHIPANTAGIEALGKVVKDYFESHMERLVVGQTLSASTEGSGLGGTGVAKMHAETKYNLLKFDAQNLDETLTDDLVGVAKQLNYPWADFPARFKSNVPDPDAADKLDAVTKVWDRVDFVKEDVRGLTGMRTPAEGDETVGGEPMTPPLDPNKGGGRDFQDDFGEEGDDGPFKGAGRDPNYQYAGAWREEDHPRGDNGRWVRAGAIREAATDPAVADRLRSKVTRPEELAKLERAIRLVRSARTDRRRAQRAAEAEARNERSEAALSQAADRLRSLGVYRVADAVRQAINGVGLAGSRGEAITAIRAAAERVRREGAAGREADARMAERAAQSVAWLPAPARRGLARALGRLLAENRKETGPDLAAAAHGIRTGYATPRADALAALQRELDRLTGVAFGLELADLDADQVQSEWEGAVWIEPRDGESNEAWHRRWVAAGYDVPGPTVGESEEGYFQRLDEAAASLRERAVGEGIAALVSLAGATDREESSQSVTGTQPPGV